MQGAETLAGPGILLSRAPIGQALARALGTGSGGWALFLWPSLPWPPGTSVLHTALPSPSPELLGPAGGRSWLGLAGFLRPTVMLPLQDTIAQAVSQVCDKVKLLRGCCKKTMKKFFGRISQDIIAGKTPREVCVDISICKPQAGECRGDSRDSFLEGPRQPPHTCVTGFKHTKIRRKLHKQLIRVPPCFLVMTHYFPHFQYGKGWRSWVCGLQLESFEEHSLRALRNIHKILVVFLFCFVFNHRPSSSKITSPPLLGCVTRTENCGASNLGK